jgi:S-adenosylmethionine hydrolase
MITLTTDFGLKDPYVAEMKGAILTINKNANIIDITHEIGKFDIKAAAFTLASAAPYFPRGTVHLAVVDPGVGTARRGVIIQTRQGFFVGPDNGVLMLAAQNQGIEHICALTNPKFMLSPVSSTFHGRDIFAPAAAHLDLGVKPSEFGPEVHDVLMPNYTSVQRSGDCLAGEVIHIDGYGNVITNIPQTLATENKFVTIKLGNVLRQVEFKKTYAQAKNNEIVALIGSQGFLELALNQGNAAKRLQAKVGDKLEVSFT